MKMVRLKLAGLALTTALASTYALPAFAQSDVRDDAGGVEEIVVTAQHRAVNVQETPISLTAITGKTLSDSGVRRVEDLANMLPNVYIDDRNLRGQNIAIRGISADLSNPGLDQGVGIFVDGVYLGRATAANMNLFNLERVEVLRGPQGTLYGKNAIAGAINYISRKPTDDAYVDASFGYGNYNAFAGHAMASGPLVEGSVFASIGGAFDQRRGLIRNSLTGRRLDNRNGQNGRAVLTFLPSDTLEITLRGDISRDRTRSGSIQAFDDGVFTGSPLDQPDPFTRVVAQNRDPYAVRDTGGISGELNWKVGGGTLTSLTAYRYSDWDNIADNDYTALDILASGIEENQRQFSQELRYASASDGAFDYVLGAYYFHQQLDTDAHSIAGPDLGVYPYEVQGSIYADVTTDSYAAFAHGTYRFDDKLSLTGGLRFTHEKKTVVHSQLGDPLQLLLRTTAPRTISRGESNVSPMVSLNYKPGKDLFLYATFSQGYKSGGFNVFSISPTDDAAYESENVNNYEIGFKSEFLDNKLRLDVAAYYLDYRNLQANQSILINGIPVFQTSNAARARSLGAEISLAARPTRELTVGATYGYIDATYPSYPNATSTGADYSGNRLPRAPRHNASLSLQYERPLTDGLSLFARGEASYRSKVYFTAENLYSQDPVTLLNARLGLQADGGKWGAYLWVRNLTNRDYVIYKEAGAIVPGQIIESVAAPRTFGLELRTRF